MTSIKRPLHIFGYCIATALATSFGLPAFSSTPDQPVIAQSSTSLIGQCRAAKQSTAVFKERKATSAVVMPLKMGDRVTLAENGGSDGFISVSAPASGFVQSVNLKLCAGDPKPPVVPPEAKGLCRRVARTPVLLESGGLNIRSMASATSDLVGGVAPGGTLTLTTSPATTKDDSAGRVWVQISEPKAGWVSNGFRNGGQSNLMMCP